MKRSDAMIISLLITLIVSIAFFAYIANWRWYGSSDQEVQIKGSQKIALLVMATGPYIKFVEPLIASANQYFCPHHEVTYFVFTEGELPQQDNVIKVPQAQLGWPYDSMMRFHTYFKHRDLFAGYDYLFACDADMHFAGFVGDEILGDLVGTVHSQLRFTRGIYECNPISTACVNRMEGDTYYAGAFYGGTREQFINMVGELARNVNIDLARGYIACVNDESHLNRYFATHQPTIKLSPSYCHFESWQSPFERKIVALDQTAHSRKHMPFDPLGYYTKMLREVM